MPSLISTTSAPRPRQAAEIASELYDIACYYDLSASQNRCAITFKGLSENMGQVMDIFEDLVANAQGDEEILANYKADLLKKRADNKLNQEANFAALQRFAFFGGEAIQRTTLNNEQARSAHVGRTDRQGPRPAEKAAHHPLLRS